MILLSFGYGIIVGLLLALLVAVLNTRFKTPVERTVNQIAAQTKPKGKILEPENEELEAWVNQLPND
jgi:MFS superfamily sulfate permease-like transporter